MRTNTKQSHDAGIELLNIAELFKEFRPELDDRTALKLAMLARPDLGERYAGSPIRRNGGPDVKNYLLNGGSIPHLTREDRAVNRQAVFKQRCPK